jgi:hypothetical protein
MKKVLFFILIFTLILSIAGCGGSNGNKSIRVSINLQKPDSISKTLSKTLDYEKVLATGKYTTYITCPVGTFFNGGYAVGLNQCISLTAKITDSSGKIITDIDESQMTWQTSDNQNIYFVDIDTGNSVTTPPHRHYLQLDIRKVGNYTVSALYQNNSGNCQVITCNATYIGLGATYPATGTVFPDYQGVVFNDDTSVSQTNDINIADLYVDYNSSNDYTYTLIAPAGIAIYPAESWNQLDQIYLYQLGDLKTIPSELTYNTQITLSSINSPQILIVKKRDNTGFIKLAIYGGIAAGNGESGPLLSIAYAMAGNDGVFPLSFD